ncbi:MAG: hypothetical protein ACLSAP_10220 [Oscillospiraceae bacterium]
MLQCKRILAMLISAACIFGCCQIASADGVKEKQPYQVLESTAEITNENDLLAMAIRQHFQRGRSEKLLPDGETRESDQINVKQVLEKRRLPDGTIQEYCSSTTLKLMEETETGDLKEVTMPEYIARAISSGSATDWDYSEEVTLRVTLYYEYQPLYDVGYYVARPVKTVTATSGSGSNIVLRKLNHGYKYKENMFEVPKYCNVLTLNNPVIGKGYTINNTSYTNMLRVDWGGGFTELYGGADLSFTTFSGKSHFLEVYAPAGQTIID